MEKQKCRLGLVGKDVSKSTSGRIHQFILGSLGIACEYQNFSVACENFDSVMRTLLGDFDGFNVTIPYKRDVMGYLNETVGDALACGAVNTVVNTTRKGYNTDGVGFMQMLSSAGIDVQGKKVLVLGAGGAGRSCGVALKNAGASVYMYRRDKKELEELCSQLGLFPVDNPETGGFDIVINSTGVGMHDSEGKSPVSANAFDGASVAVDLIYEPKKSEFLRLAEEKGLKIYNGAPMLFYQAYYADCLFLDRMPNAAEAEELYKNYLTKGE